MEKYPIKWTQVVIAIFYSFVYTKFYSEKKVCNFLWYQLSIVRHARYTDYGCNTINYETMDRQLASDNNANERKRNYQHERAVETDGSEPNSCTNKKQDVDIQKQCNTDNTAEPSVNPNPMAMVNNKYENNSLLSEPINDDNERVISEQFREDGMKANMKQTQTRTCKRVDPGCGECSKMNHFRVVWREITVILK